MSNIIPFPCLLNMPLYLPVWEPLYYTFAIKLFYLHEKKIYSNNKKIWRNIINWNHFIFYSYTNIIWYTFQFENVNPTFSLNSSCGMTDNNRWGSIAKSSWIRSNTCSDKSLTDDLPSTKTWLKNYRQYQKQKIKHFA